MNMVETFQTMQALGVSFEGVETAEGDEISSKNCVRPSRQDVELVSRAGKEFKHTILRLVTLVDSLPSSLPAFPGGNPVHNELNGNSPPETATFSRVSYIKG